VEMRVIIVGAGKIGRELAARIAARHQVMLLDNHADRLEQIGPPHEPGDSVQVLSDDNGLVCVHGDGTSRLVLQTLYDSEVACALVATSSTDEGNLEAGRLARELGFEPVIAVCHDTANVSRYRDERISAIDRARLLADQVERVLHHRGAIVPSGIGLGQGELVEVRLLRSSPVLNRPLKNLALYRWRIAAIFRGEELIVPTGESTLQVDDRVLVVGDPKILATVTEYLRRGTPQFPRPFGPNVVVIDEAGADEALAAEAEWLACQCAAAHLVIGAPGVEDDLPAEDDEEPLTCPVCDREVPRRTFTLPLLKDEIFATRLARQRPGVVVTRPSRRGLINRALGIRGRDAVLCDLVRAPVLFSRAPAPIKRIMLPVSFSEMNIASAEVAIDITRQLKASLTAVNVDLPRYISGLTEEEIHGEVVPIRRLCELYEVPLEYRHREGNPVHHLVHEATQHDLIVVARRHGRRDSYVDPDVALRVARQAPCSVLVVTVRPEA